jgi:hypothetical protein
VQAGFKAPDGQFWFNKQVLCLNGPYDDVQLSAMSERVGWTKAGMHCPTHAAHSSFRELGVQAIPLHACRSDGLTLRLARTQMEASELAIRSRPSSKRRAPSGAAISTLLELQNSVRSL